MHDLSMTCVTARILILLHHRNMAMTFDIDFPYSAMTSESLNQNLCLYCMHLTRKLRLQQQYEILIRKMAQISEQIFIIIIALIFNWTLNGSLNHQLQVNIIYSVFLIRFACQRSFVESSLSIYRRNEKQLEFTRNFYSFRDFIWLSCRNWFKFYLFIKK